MIDGTVRARTLRQYFGLLALTLALLLSGNVAAAGTVSDISGAEDYESGQLLPPIPMIFESGGVLASGSTEYFAHRYYQYEVGGQEKLLIHRTSDGSLVRSIPVVSETACQPRIEGSKLVTLETPGSDGYCRTLVVRDIESNDVIATLTTPERHVRIAQAADWLLTCKLGGTTGDCQAHLQTVDGLDMPLDITINSGAKVAWIDNVTGKFFIEDQQRRLWRIDPATGDRALSDFEVPKFQTPNRFFSWDDHWEGDYRVNTLTWRERDGSGGGSVIVDTPSHEYVFVAFGDRVAALHIPADGSSYRRELRPVNLMTGALEPAVVDGVEGWGSVQLSDGRLLVVSGQRTTTGKILSVADDGLEPTRVMELPERGKQFSYLSMNQGTVMAEVAESWPEGEPTHSFNIVDGQDWVPLSSEYPLLAVEGEVSLYRLTGQKDAYRLQWPGGRRDVVSVYGAPTLGRGGELIAVNIKPDGSPAFYRIEGARDGMIRRDLPVPAARPVLDGSWAWDVDKFGTQISGFDVLTGETRVAETGLSCSTLAGELRVFDRWATITCGERAHVIDLLGVVDAWSVDPRRIVLGNGFVVWTTSEYNIKTTGNIGTYSAVHVKDLSGHGPVRSFGPADAEIATDSSGAPRFVYRDTHGQVRLVELDGLAEAPIPRADTTAPALVSSSGTAAAVMAKNGTAEVNFQWKFEDRGSRLEPASGLVEHDIRYRLDAGAWVMPVAWQGTVRQAVNQTVAAGQRVCFEVRARDLNDNVSDWLGQRCTYVDGQAPSVTRVGVSASIVDRPDGTSTFSYRSADDDAVASHEVAVQSAAAGKAFGAWSVPTGWRALKVTQVSRVVASGETACFRVRATDRAGNSSAWSRSVCSTGPYDDRALKSKGKVRRTKNGSAMNRTLSDLRGKGASLVRGKQRGRHIAITARCGPKEGKVVVWIGKVKVGKVPFKCSKTGLVTRQVTAPKELRGALKIVAGSNKRVRIDSVAVVR